MFDRRQDPAVLASHCELDGLEHLRAALAAGHGAWALAHHEARIVAPVHHQAGVAVLQAHHLVQHLEEGTELMEEVSVQRVS